MDDAALAAQAQAGDARALAELVQRHYGTCWRFALRMLDDGDDAEDAVQETFVRMHRGLSRYQERQQFRAWLLQILVNQCRMAARTRSRHRKRFVRDSNALAVAAVPEMVVEQPVLAEAIAGLEPKYREALLLKYGEGLQYREMVAITGVEESALKMRVKRACEFIRARFPGGLDG